MSRPDISIVLPNGGLAGPRGPRHDFIDDEHRPAAVAVLLVEIAAFDEARAHNGEVAGSDRPKVGGGRSGLLLRDALRTVGAVPVRQILIQRKVGNGADTLHAGHGGEFRFALDDGAALLGRIAHRELECEQVPRFESGLHLFHLGETCVR